MAAFQSRKWSKPTVEIDGFNIVRAICSKFVAPERVVMRDAKSYCAILLDDNKLTKRLRACTSIVQPHDISGRFRW